MRRIIVLGGGNSVEREVSLRSSREVVKALKTNKYIVDFVDPRSSNEYLKASSEDIVFPILHGEFGEDGVVQKELEDRNIPYLGTDSISSKVCFDKWLTRLELEKNNLPIAKGVQVDANNYRKSSLSKQPHVLKAVNGGSSIGTAIVRSSNPLDERAIKSVFSIHSRAVIEELVEGVEITVPILDNQALPVIEIQPPKNEEFDYQNKYNGKTKEICPPVSISVQAQKEAQILALKVHKALKCRHLSRVDIIVKPNGEMVVLELNTMPGMTDQSLYPKAALQASISFAQLTNRFVKLVEQDYGL